MFKLFQDKKYYVYMYIMLDTIHNYFKLGFIIAAVQLKENKVLKTRYTTIKRQKIFCLTCQEKRH